MKKILISTLAISALLFTSCSQDSDTPADPVVTTPENYVFTRDGKSTVSFSGQETRLAMASELKTALGKDGVSTSTLESLTSMFKDGKGFSTEALNNSGKKLRSTVAAGTNTILSTEQKENIQKALDNWIKEFAQEVIPAKDVDASKGKAGNLEAKRYVNAKGLESNQAVAKTLIGSLILDQVVNKYISTKYLNDAKDAHEAGTVYKEGTNYTKLEHGWDEAYGYVFGKVNEKQVFLGKYLGKVAADADFSTYLTDVGTAFKRGRQAIVVKNYTVMHEQAAIIRDILSKVIAIRAVYYLAKGKGTKDQSTLHALSEGYGFVYSLMFAHKNGNQIGYDTPKTYIDKLDKEDGFWSVTDETLQEIAEEIAKDFGFTVAQTLN